MEEAMKYNLIPVFPDDVCFGGKDNSVVPPNNNNSNITPTKKNKKEPFINNKKKNKKHPSTPPPTPPPTPPVVALKPPHHLYVGLVVHKAIQVLATTNLFDYGKDIHAKLLKALRDFALVPVEKYFPPPGTDRWKDIKAAAKSKFRVHLVCILLYGSSDDVLILMYVAYALFV